MRQIPDDPILSNRYQAEGQRTELAMNVRTEDAMTNGTRYVVNNNNNNNNNYGITRYVVNNNNNNYGTIYHKQSETATPLLHLSQI